MADGRAGASILHYRILRPIGSGGMGVVYEAEDTKLGRRVALKFLPPGLSRDSAALERFVREARAASALTHPHICTIYAIEEADDARFIAMELLEGESLDRLAARRPLSWSALVDTGVQIADALDAAHRRGIIHRDIKPANIFVTHDGRAKVLDFGVAKLAMDRLAEAETIGEETARALTGDGVAIGTVAYMSPEQARGDALDARTDLFALAAVLYELSTGRRAFDGRTSAVIFSKILESDPEAPRALNPTLPPKLEDVILRGLEKDRELRYQSAADMRADLKRLKRDASSGRLAFVPPATAAGAPPLSSGALLASEMRRRKGLAASIALVAMALLGAAGYGLYALTKTAAGASAGDPPASAAMTLTRLTTTGDVRGCASISPDGNLVAYCTLAGKLKVRQVATGATVDLGNIEGATTFSPDGNFIYVSAFDEAHPQGVLWAIPSFGGEPRRVLTNLIGAVGIAPDGQQVAFVRRDQDSQDSALMIASVRGGEARRIATARGDERFEGYGVDWSPDGALLVLTLASATGGYSARPAVVAVDTGRIETPGTRGWPDSGRTVWLPDNSGILFTARDKVSAPLQFWIVRYPDGDTRRITSDGRGFGNMSVSVTADGSTAVTVPWEIVTNIWSTNADATAPLEQWTSGSRYDGYGIAQVSSGRIFYGSYTGSEMGIWTVDAPGGRPRQLTPEFATNHSVPPDGRFVVYGGMHEGRFRIWRMDPDGANARVISKGEDDVRPFVSPDGRWIYYTQAGARSTIVRAPSDGTGEPIVVTDRPVGLLGVAPDGRSLLAWAPDSEAAGYEVLDAGTGAVTARLSLPSDTVGWGRRSDLVAFVRDLDGVSNVWEQPISGGPPRQITKFTSGQIFHFAYSADGARLLLSRGTRTGDIWALKNFR